MNFNFSYEEIHVGLKFFSDIPNWIYLLYAQGVVGMVLSVRKCLLDLSVLYESPNKLSYKWSITLQFCYFQ